MATNSRDNKSVLPLQQKDVTGNGRVFNFGWTHVFSPALVNELRLGYVRGVYGDSIEESDPTAVGVSNSLLNTLPGLLLPNSLNFGGFTGSILATTQNTYQLADNVSWVRGRHALKFGFKIDENRFRNGERIDTNGRANFNGLFSTGNSSIGTGGNRNNAVADLLLGLPNSHSLTTPQLAHLQNRPWATYIQDDWKVNNRVTVNAGLRYEYHQPFRENLLGGSRVDLENGGRLLVADPVVAQLANSPLVVYCTSPRVVDSDKNDFGPRIGVAIQPFKDGLTVIRAGYGIFMADTSQFFHRQKYTPFRRGSFQGSLTSFQNPTISLDNLFPSSQFTPTTGSGISLALPGGVNPAAVNNQPVLGISSLGSYDTPQSQQWSVSLQRQFPWDMLVDLTYAGSVSKNLPLQWFFNQPTFSATPANLLSLDPAAQPYLRRQFANFTIGSNIVANVLSSNYNAGTAKVTKRFSQGYSFTSTYTWSKNIDQGAEIFTVFANHAFIANNLNFDDSKGVSALDVPHRWVTNGIVELPFGKGKRFNSGGLTDKLVGGWRFSGVLTVQSGLPINPYIFNRLTNTGLSIPERGDLVGPPYLSGDAWDAAVRAWERDGARLFLIPFGSISLNYAPGTLGTIPRNFFRAPYGRLLNISAAKVTRFGETNSLEVRMDMFNVTREVLHRLGSATNYTHANALTSPLLGSMLPRSAFFAPHTIQLGVRFTF